MGEETAKSFLVLWEDQVGDHFQWEYSPKDVKRLIKTIEGDLQGEVYFASEISIVKNLLEKEG